MIFLVRNKPYEINIKFVKVYKLCFRYLLLLCLISLFNNIIEAQNAVIKHYGVTHGLPSSETYYVTQDSRGYLWIASDAGVVKYDGYKFHTYNTNKGLPDNTVFKIHEDKYGRIWFASYSGKMAYYSYETDSVYGIPANDKLSELIKVGIADFAFDEKDTLYISSSRLGYVKVEPPYYNKVHAFAFKFSAFFLKELNNKQFIYGNYLDFKKHSDDRRPLLFEDSKNHFYDDTLFNMSKVVSAVSAIKKNGDSYLFCDHKSIVEVFKKNKKIVLDSLPIKNDLIISLTNDHMNHVWVNTHSNGTFLYDTLNNRCKTKRFLENKSVTCVFEDKEHGYWMTTLEDGLYYIPSLQFEVMHQIADTKFERIHSLVIKNKNIFFLTADGHFYELDKVSRKINSAINMPLSAAYLLGYNNSLLICSAASILIDEKSGEHHYLFIKNESGNTDVRTRIKKAFVFDENYLIGYYDGNVIKISKQTGESKIILENLPIIFSIYVMNQEIWIGTKNGVYSYKNGKLIYHGNEDPRFKKRVDGMVHVGNKLFFATRGYGVFCYENKKITQHYTEQDGLASNLCKTIIKDSVGNIWVGTNRGVSRLKAEQDGLYSVNTMNISNGLLSSEINQMVIDQGSLYLATNKGLSIVKISEAFNSTVSIPVYIESFLINDIKSDYKEHSILSHDQNFIKISYKGVYAKAEGDIKYKYKLEGLDTAWTYTKNTFLQFTTLPPGNYKFIVYAINFDGKLSDHPAVISFVINSPFWVTWWFLFLVALTISLVVYFIYQRRIRLIQKQESEKTEFYKQIAESELKALRAQMNPHFMFNAINSIQSFVLKNDGKSAQKYLTKFARLIRSVLENSKYETISLSKEVETLSLYIELECLRASFSFDYEIIVGDNIHIEKMQIPPMVLQPYIENAILHGLTPLSERKGNLKLEFGFENSVLKCIIDDNGIGRKKAAEINAKKRAGHKSMGLEVTSERLEILNKNNLFKINVLMIDKVHNDEAQGTRVEIYFEYIK